jgi:1,4-dihydroxy-2-naphthoate octaprenyltransferase
MGEMAQEFIICVQKIHFKSIKYILFTCILLVEGSNLKNMASESDKSTGKDEDEVKSTPSIIKPKGRTAVGF